MNISYCLHAALISLTICSSVYGLPSPSHKYESLVEDYTEIPVVYDKPPNDLKQVFNIENASQYEKKFGTSFFTISNQAFIKSVDQTFVKACVELPQEGYSSQNFENYRFVDPTAGRPFTERQRIITALKDVEAKCNQVQSSKAQFQSQGPINQFFFRFPLKSEIKSLRKSATTAVKLVLEFEKHMEPYIEAPHLSNK